MIHCVGIVYVFIGEVIHVLEGLNEMFWISRIW